MRLDDFDSSINVEDQRGGGGGRFPMGGGGKLGCGSIVIALIAALVFGVDPAQMLGSLQQSQVSTPAQQQGGSTLQETCSVNEFSRESCNALSSLNKTWTPLFAQANIAFQPPKLWFYSQAGQSGCGAAQSAMGPFYCPADNGIYIDTDFFAEMDQRMGAGGDFARVYVMAHEYGHHIQNVLGTSSEIRQMQQRSPSEANRLSVALELQADCYAGVWAGRNRDRIEAGDIEEGMRAAHQIGDDTLMKAAGRRPVEDAFTHGSAAQRMQWLQTGIETADEDQCNTFK